MITTQTDIRDYSELKLLTTTTETITMMTLDQRAIMTNTDSDMRTRHNVTMTQYRHGELESLLTTTTKTMTIMTLHQKAAMSNSVT